LESLRSVSKAKKDHLVESALERVPRGLDNTYKRILHQIDEQGDYMKTLALKAFTWVLYAIRSLRVNELRNALATEGPVRRREDLDLDSIDVILEACANLLIVENDIVRPVHFSVQEFLTNPPPCALQDLFIESIQVPEFVQKKLALTCIFNLQLDILHGGPCRELFDLYDRLIENPFLWHSARFFDHYVRRLKHIPDEVLLPLQALIHQDSSFLAAILQTRKIPRVQIGYDIQHNFDYINYPVDISTIIYGTKLYDIALFNAQLFDRQVPQYALHIAAATGSLPAVTRLIEAGCSLEEEDESGRTPLHIAALEGHLSIFEQLLEIRDEASTPSSYYDHVLQAASYGGQVEIVQLLLKKGVDVNVQGGFYGTALQAASRKGQVDIVQLLLKNGANVNAFMAPHFKQLHAKGIRKSYSCCLKMGPILTQKLAVMALHSRLLQIKGTRKSYSCYLKKGPILT